MSAAAHSSTMRMLGGGGVVVVVVHKNTKEMDTIAPQPEDSTTHYHDRLNLELADNSAAPGASLGDRPM